MNYKLFTTPTCKSCPEVKAHMETVKLEGEKIDASTPDGREKALELGIRSVPTVVFYENDEVKGMAQSVKQVNEFLNT